MEFLYKLYDNEYFGLALIIVIAILVLLFLLILFLGKKDEKNRKLEETRRLELENTTKEENVVSANIEENIPEIEQPIMVEEKEEEPLIVEQDFTGNFSIPSLDVKEVEEQPIIEETRVDSINNLFETPSFNTESPVRETQEDNNINSFDSINIDDLFGDNSSEEKEEKSKISSFNDEIAEEPVVVQDIPTFSFEQPKPKVEAPFSSVYMNTDALEKKNENVFELPKTASFEMPKAKEDVVENEIKEDVTPVKEDISDFDSLFGDIETETYNLK